jgi:peptidoglycan-N-acetylglucosamine deacetylase
MRTTTEGVDIKTVALTFDDGPSPSTDHVLDILDEYQATATFFCIGRYVAEHPEIVRRVAERGHSVQNHTWSHRSLHELTASELLNEIEATNRLLFETTGSRPSLLRPPYGMRTPDVLDTLARHGMTSVLWNVDPRDWDCPGADVIAETVLQDVRDRSVLLLHDGSPDGESRTQTVAALPRILEGLLARGYRFVSADDASVAVARIGDHIPYATASASLPSADPEDHR